MASQTEDDMDDDEDKEKDESMEDSDADDGELIDVPPIDYSEGDSANEDDDEISSDSAGDSDDMEEDDFKTDEDKEDLIEVEDEEGPLDWDNQPSKIGLQSVAINIICSFQQFSWFLHRIPIFD